MSALSPMCFKLGPLLTTSQVLARAFLAARKAVPTRPHPWAPQTGGALQKAAGMQGKFHDKIIETLGNRKFTNLKVEHPEV